MNDCKLLPGLEQFPPSPPQQLAACANRGIASRLAAIAPEIKLTVRGSGLNTFSGIPYTFLGSRKQPNARPFRPSVALSIIKLLQAVSSHSPRSQCRDCGTRLIYRDCTFSFEGRSWEVSMPICPKCDIS